MFTLSIGLKFVFRGQIIGKVAKYPHVGDYRQFVDELDEKEFLSLRLIAAELRNHYVSLLLSDSNYIRLAFFPQCIADIIHFSKTSYTNFAVSNLNGTFGSHLSQFFCFSVGKN